MLRHIWQFAASESCGACSPCRVGSRCGLELASADTPPGHEWKRLSHVLAEACLCAFGRRIPPAVHSLARAYGGRLAGWDPCITPQSCAAGRTLAEIILPAGSVIREGQPTVPASEMGSSPATNS
ncbi:NADH-ubiquinone oxidoreductase-F iron-sulfur binding region domain-containing protein [Streptomyces sp. NBC_00057]|uniref:NADH-ubiquinone oxidoreductase-F iron-sulfur binding region domain-containing protein n=1 Tax=Streptomyces sp. NBC_00057 TaxID=2975634 RepID=UPI0032478B82